MAVLIRPAGNPAGRFFRSSSSLRRNEVDLTLMRLNANTSTRRCPMSQTIWTARNFVRRSSHAFVVLIFLGLLASVAAAQGKRKVIIDQDCAGPGGTDMQAILTLINSPETDVLGITVVTGDAWRDEEVQHTLRLLEIIGRTDIPVLPGAVFPIVNSKEAVAEWEKKFGKVTYQGAW